MASSMHHDQFKSSPVVTQIEGSEPLHNQTNLFAQMWHKTSFEY